MLAGVVVFVLFSFPVAGQPPPAPQPTRRNSCSRPDVLRAFDEELSGTLMRDHVGPPRPAIHRVPASPGYHEAAEWLMARARAYGLSDVHVESFPGDGKTWFGTMRGNRGWRVEGGELAEVSPHAAPDRVVRRPDDARGGQQRERRRDRGARGRRRRRRRRATTRARP